MEVILLVQDTKVDVAKVAGKSSQVCGMEWK